MSGVGPYPRYDILSKADSAAWDDTTRRVVENRLRPPVRRFLSADEWETLEAVCARLIPQPDRGAEAVAITPWIDASLHQGESAGYRLEGLPVRPIQWQRGLRAIEEECQAAHGASFSALTNEDQDALLSRVSRGEVTGAGWEGLPPEVFFWNALVDTVAGVYYAHPAALSEIGFGGPASPQGYVRLGIGQRDPWESETSHAAD